MPACLLALQISYEKGASVLRMLRAYLNRDSVSQEWLRTGTLRTDLRRRALQQEEQQQEPEPEPYAAGGAGQDSGVQHSGLEQPGLAAEQAALASQQPGPVAEQPAAAADAATGGAAGQQKAADSAAEQPAATISPAAGQPQQHTPAAADDTFLAGLHRYLATNAYGSVTSTKLWDAMSNATGGWGCLPACPPAACLCVTYVHRCSLCSAILELHSDTQQWPAIAACSQLKRLIGAASQGPAARHTATAKPCTPQHWHSSCTPHLAFSTADLPHTPHPPSPQASQ
jgi:hypothetical protein